jgi:hypothetical protein
MSDTELFDIEYDDVKKVSIEFLGNYREYIFKEVYELDEDEAAIFVALGYAKYIN